MKIDCPDGCDQEWRLSLSPWQRRTLGEVFRQGQGLRDGTNHGSDERWRQAGVKTRASNGFWHRTPYPSSRSHTRILIERTDYGFAVSGLARDSVVVLDTDTAKMTTVEGWSFVWTWYVSREMTSSFPPRLELQHA